MNETPLITSPDRAARTVRKPSHDGRVWALSWSVTSTSLFGSAPWSPLPLTVEVTAQIVTVPLWLTRPVMLRSPSVAGAHRAGSAGGRDASWYREAVAQRIGVVVFPGTNCEHDVVEAFEALGAEAELVWHASASLGGLDAVVLPGGFAHGDYLRPGAIARFSPVMTAVSEFAAYGGPVLGICNGFQVLTEAHLLPGALQKNKGLTFLCQMTEVEVVSDRSVLTAGVQVGRTLARTDKPFRGQLHRRARDTPAARIRRPSRPSLCRQPQRLCERHCRCMQRARQCGWAYAPP